MEGERALSYQYGRHDVAGFLEQVDDVPVATDEQHFHHQLQDSAPIGFLPEPRAFEVFMLWVIFVVRHMYLYKNTHNRHN
jgi:hypothetical protein